MKKLIGIFLLCCMVFSMLPVVALAEADDVLVKVYVSPTKFDQIDIYAKKGTVTYAKNRDDGYLEIVKAGVSDGTKYDYNLKLDFSGDKPVLYLNGLNLGRYNAETGEYSIPLQGLEFPVGYAVPDIVVESDSSITCWSECLGFRNGGTLTSVGDAKLTLFAGNGGIWVQGEGATLTINANLDITIPDVTYSTSAVCIGTEQTASIVIAGGTINLSGYRNALRVMEGDLTINGGTINAVSRGNEEQAAIKVNGNVTVNGGTLKAANYTEDGGDGFFVNNGDMVINGGSVYAEGWNCAIENKGGGNLIINGGTLEAKSLNDGTRYNVFSTAPDLSKYGTYDAYMGMSEDNTQFYNDPDGLLKMKYFKITQGTGSTTAPTKAPTQATTAPTQAPTQATKPATKPTAPTKAPTQPTSTTEGDSSMTQVIIWAAVAVAVIAVAAAAIIVVKKTKK